MYTLAWALRLEVVSAGVGRGPLAWFLLENRLRWVQISSMVEEQKALQIRWTQYPELAALCWNLHMPLIAAAEALRLYEDNWRFVNQATMPASEKKLVNWLAGRFGSYLHV